jgi:ADP-heptose:LPS heptosyltransferase
VRAMRRAGMQVIELGSLPSQTRCETFGHLLHLIRRARLVVSVDTGPLALALALGTPVVALFGPSDARTIVEQFRRYRPSMDATVIASHTYGGCAAPCNFTEARGWQVDGKCKRIADCMAGIPPEEILDTIRRML